MQKFVQQSQVLVPVSGTRLPQPSNRGAFVVNLGSSSTPVALSSPEHPELKKFTFFVSRRREGGRERFRLHMGYFDTQQDAESLLHIVRDIYPGAWAGIAPGRKAPESVPLPPVAASVAVPDAQPTGVPPAPRPTMELRQGPVPPPQEKEEHLAAKQSLSSVRAAIASLDDNGTPPARKPDDSQVVATLSQTQTLKLLESTGSMPAPAARTARPPEAAAAYAVQLRWSMQPIGMSELPPLAIFAAYALYRAKGRHEGSYWHALRLGFFQDQISANQVANYIRPEFGDVTVVAVGAAERNSAMAATASRAALPKAIVNKLVRPMPPGAAGTGKPGAADTRANEADGLGSGQTGQFKLIEDGVQPNNEPSRLEMLLTTEPAVKPAAPAQAQAGKGNEKDKDKAKAGARRPPTNLEETLDVLGAGNLKLDSSKNELIDPSSARRMRHAAERKPPARSALSKLFDRLAENIGGSGR